METGPPLRVPTIPGYSVVEVLWHDQGLVLCRGRRESDQASFLLESSLRADVEPRVREKMERAYSFRHDLDPSWALSPVHQERAAGLVFSVFEDPGGDTLARVLRQPRTMPESLRIAVGLARALAGLHARGIIHKDIKPENTWLDGAGRVRLMGFGFASRLPRERQEAGPPEVLAGSLPYMSPEQTGRMNRSIDARSDLYSLGVTLYLLFTKVLPFEARDPMAWVHCHIARQAAPPHERDERIPPQLSAVVMKLLSKTAEERYQTAAGVEADLRLCLEAWENQGAIEPFPLGVRDVPARLLLPEKLYGRERESRQLLDAFARVETLGRPELVLVSGYSGIGKSSLVNELHGAMIRSRGLFASGKFGLQRSDEPYFIFVQAFQSLVARILSASSQEVKKWRAAILNAVGANGRVLTDLIPALALVIGPQPDVPELSLVHAKNRLHAVFIELVGAFARPEHPLVLFLDDLQWLDSGSLALFEHLATDPDAAHLLLVGAYRDNEVDAAHPLTRTLEAVRAAKVPLTELRLMALDPADVGRLVADAVHREPAAASSLAQCVYEKTGGNPFFTLQFLHFLEDERLLEFVPAREAWCWEIDRIHAQSITDNVAELVVDKLERLPTDTLQVLEYMASLGNALEMSTLARILDHSESRVRDSLWPAVLAGIVTSSAGSYRFSHDRIQEAAYSLVPPSRRAALHVKIGRRLLGGSSDAAIAEDPFTLADQFNRGLEEIADPVEKRAVRRLNTNAGRKAMASAAFGSASAYLLRARSLLPPNPWDSDYSETLRLLLDAGEADFMAGQPGRAESLFREVLAHAPSLAERAEVFRRRAKLHRVAGHYLDALESGAEGLRALGFEFPPATDPSIAGVIGEHMARLQEALHSRSVAELTSAPPAVNPEARAAIALAAEMLGPAYYSKSPYLALAAAAGALTTIEHGPSADSPTVFSASAFLLAAMGDIDIARQLSEVALSLQERVGDEAARGAFLVSYATMAIWRHPFASCVKILEESLRAALRVGNTSAAADAAMTEFLARFEAGEPIDRLAHAAEEYVGFARSSRNSSVYVMSRFFQQFVDSFREPARRAAADDSQQTNPSELDEATSLVTLEQNGFSAGIVIYHVLQQISAFIFGRYEDALAHSRQAEPHLINPLFTLQERNQPLFQALAAAALHDSAPADERRELAQLMVSALEPLGKMAEYGPENYGDRLALVQAEVARIEGRELDAIRLYDKAIAAARAQDLVHREGLANEVAARFYAQRGFGTIAQAYLRAARAAYLRWGASAKVKQLDELHRGLHEQRTGVEAGTAAAPRDLDLLTVVKASQAVSDEIVRERFIEKLLSIMLESAGADRGALVRPEELGFVVEAEAWAQRGGVEVRVVDELLSAERFPESMLRFATRTGERVLLDDATAKSEYSDDPYVLTQRPRSVLVLPLVKRSVIVALLYLENRLATRAFTPGRLAVLQLLTGQAAISLENARLYRKVQQAEARFSKAFHDSPSPMAIVRVSDEVILDANTRFLETYGYPREEFLGHSIRELGLIERDEAERLGALLLARGWLREEELTIKNRQGKMLSLLGSLEPIELDGESCALLTHVDITARKQMEFQLRQSQKMEAIGRLAGGVAHDFNNLLTVINGSCAMVLDDLGEGSPHYASVREILEAGERAAALTRQLLAHSRMQAQQTKAWNLNVIVADMVPMLQRLIGEDTRLETELEPGLGQVKVDRGQVEQILLNLVVNARDAIPSNGRIVIRTGNVRLDRAFLDEHVDSPAGSQVMLAVSDTGTGMTPEVKAKLFEPFFTTKPAGQGTGLGLSVVYGIVKQSGGHISVYSEPGMGSVFRVYLPEIASPSEAVPAERAASDSRSFRGHESVLIVEDSQQVRRFAAKALTAKGYRVTEAANGVEALRLLHARDDIEIVVSDVVMPDMGGATLARSIRSLRPSVPIVLMSGFVEHTEVRASIAVSGQRLLQKPFTGIELARRVRESLDDSYANVNHRKEPFR